MEEISRRDALRLGVGVVASGYGFSFASAPKAKVIAGSGQDVLIARHVALEGTYRDIGRALGELGKTHGARLGAGEAAMTARRAAWFEKNWPELASRAKGLTDVYGAKGVDPFGLSYNVMTGPGCSCSYYPPDRTSIGHALLSRNYDFSTGTLAHLTGSTAPAGTRGFTADPYLIETRPKGGIATLMMVSYDLGAGCIDGMNEHGLGVALLADDQAGGGGRASGNQVGLGEIEVPRYLLERCRNVEECIALAKKIPYYFTFIPCHYIVGDPTGRSAVIEWEAVTKKLHIVEGGRKPQVVTNHLLSAHPDGLKRPDDGPGGSFTRYKKLRQEIDPRGKMSKAEIIAFHKSVMPPGSGAAVGQPVGRTLWHSIYDLKARTLEISFYLRDDPSAERGQKRTPYLKFGL